MALGANRRQIKLMVLQEVLILSTMSTLIGITISLIATYTITLFTSWEFEWVLSPILMGSCTTIIIGILSGYIPAVNASKLDPIAAISQ